MMSKRINSITKMNKAILFLGYCLSFIGWSYFVFCMSAMVFLEETVAGVTYAPKMGPGFMVCGYFLVPGWLLIHLEKSLAPLFRKIFTALESPFA